MDKDRIQGSVEQAKGKVKEGVGKVTSDAKRFLTRRAEVACGHVSGLSVRLHMDRWP